MPFAELGVVIAVGWPSGGRHGSPIHSTWFWVCAEGRRLIGELRLDRQRGEIRFREGLQ